MKAIHVKPALYAFYYETLKSIACAYGYNLVLHGSMNRDLDLIAVPWSEPVKPYEEMIKEFAKELGGVVMGMTDEQKHCFPHGRLSYVINIRRTDNETGEDLMYYLDISVIPPFISDLNKAVNDVLNSKTETEKAIKDMSKVSREQMQEPYMEQSRPEPKPEGKTKEEKVQGEKTIVSILHYKKKRLENMTILKGETYIHYDDAVKAAEEYTAPLLARIRALEGEKWIPVSEKLPESDGIYLVATRFGDVDMIEFQNHNFGVYEGTVFIKSRNGVITHWQSLPSTPIRNQ